MGYSDQQKRDLQATINAIDADIMLSGTPIDLTRIVTVNKPVVRVRYDLKPRQGSLGLLEKAIQAKVFGSGSGQASGWRTRTTRRLVSGPLVAGVTRR